MTNFARTQFLRLLALCALLGAPGTAPAGAFGELVCDDTARVEKSLTQRLGAERQAKGVRAPDALLELWIVPSSGAWTMVQSYANGTSCIVAMGEYWEPVLRKEPA